MIKELDQVVLTVDLPEHCRPVKFDPSARAKSHRLVLSKRCHRSMSPEKGRWPFNCSRFARIQPMRELAMRYFSAEEPENLQPLADAGVPAPAQSNSVILARYRFPGHPARLAADTSR